MNALKNTCNPKAAGQRNHIVAAMFVAAFCGLSFASDPCPSTPVRLGQATATFSQTCSGASTFLVSKIIDGNPATGWAIYQGSCGLTENSFDQTAVAETETDLVSPVPGQPLVLQLSLFSGFNSGTITPHTLGLFRLSVTGDPRSTFADSLSANGDVSANWVVITPYSMVAEATNSTGVEIPGAAASLTVQPDGSILASGPSPEYTRYRILAPSPLPVVTGVRLEVIDTNGLSSATALGLPTGGPGRAINGNFILYEMTMATARCLEVCEHPASAITCAGGSASFSVTSGGIGPFSYQWRKDSTPIDSLLNPSAATSTLTLTNITSADIAAYDVIVTNAEGCGSVTSNPATLTICPGDFNCDGGVDGTDIETFFLDWEAGNAAADINEDGGIDGSDVEVFFGRWEAGC